MNNHKSDTCFRNPSKKPKGQTWCDHCYKMTNHTTENCRSKDNNRDNKNKNDKNKSQRQKDGPCTRCGRYGHRADICTAAQVAPEDVCPCGNEFHTPADIKCPWDGDPEKRRKYQEANMPGTLICQWCKTSDGEHEVGECTKVTIFKDGLFNKIARSYDALGKCWHCQSRNHKTRGCTMKQYKEAGETHWNAMIQDKVNEWINTERTADRFHREYANGTLNDEDERNYATRPLDEYMRPPEAHEIKWCYVCQEFGHEKKYDCDGTEFNRRMHGQAGTGALAGPIVRRVQFGSGDSGRMVGQFTDGANIWPRNNSQPAMWSSPDTVTVPCSGCRRDLRFSTQTPASEHEHKVCPSCMALTRHPFVEHRRVGLSETDKMYLLLAAGRNGGDMNLEGIRSILGGNVSKDYLKGWGKIRPSVALPRHIAVERWPSHQPRYDLNLRRATNYEPIFNQNVDVFNFPGNNQSYFPPTLFRLTEKMRAERDEDEHPINQAGRLGRARVCRSCKTRAFVMDAEGDLVMCNAEAPTTVGMGTGKIVWDRVGDWGVCRCSILLPGYAEHAWIAPNYAETLMAPPSRPGQLYIM